MEKPSLKTRLFRMFGLDFMQVNCYNSSVFCSEHDPKARRPMPQPRYIDLSIDFDFFVRELIDWDWSHGETNDNLWSITAWAARYVSSPFNIMDATDPAVHADVMPGRAFFRALQGKGLSFGARSDFVARRVGIADSHKEAFDFFRQSEQPHMLVNIDAHHDVFRDAKVPLSCENWVSHLHAYEWPKARYMQVYPKWQDTTLQWDRDTAKDCEVPLVVKRWKAFRFPARSVLRHIFICRSSAWTPPHLDNQFMRLVHCAGEYSGTEISVLDQLLVRKAPSYAEHKTFIEQHNERWKTLNDALAAGTLAAKL